jgi:hypothetical protein
MAPCRPVIVPCHSLTKRSKGRMQKSRPTMAIVRDALVIFVVVAAGLYVLSHPEKTDAFLNWMLGRH